MGCRCKICEGSILKSKKRQDVDAIIHARQVEKHLQVQRKASCRCIGPKKSIYNSEYQSLADTLVPKRASATANIKVLQIHQTPEKQISASFRIFQSRYTSKQEKTMQSSELESGLPDEAEQECIVFFLPERLP